MIGNNKTDVFCTLTSIYFSINMIQVEEGVLPNSLIYMAVVYCSIATSYEIFKMNPSNLYHYLNLLLMRLSWKDYNERNTHTKKPIQ